MIVLKDMGSIPRSQQCSILFFLVYSGALVSHKSTIHPQYPTNQIINKPDPRLLIWGPTIRPVKQAAWDWKSQKGQRICWAQICHWHPSLLLFTMPILILSFYFLFNLICLNYFLTQIISFFSQKIIKSNFTNLELGFILFYQI